MSLHVTPRPFLGSFVTVTESDYGLRHVHPPERNNSGPTGPTGVKFYIGRVLLKCVEKIQLLLKLGKKHQALYVNAESFMKWEELQIY
jgi:hypothetical protein